MYECGLDSVHSEQDLMVVSYEHGIKSPCLMKGVKFVHKLRDCQFLENNLAS
jgi:hypothetical protein